MYGEIMSKKEKKSKKKKKVNEGLDRVKKTFWGLTGWAVYGAKTAAAATADGSITKQQPAPVCASALDGLELFSWLFFSEWPRLIFTSE